MTEQEPRSDQASDLRRYVEEMIRLEAPRVPATLEALSPEEARCALHELRVHQIELEMQNEELRRAQAELDASRARYFDLYNLAPVGYCTLSETGLILEANLAVATMFGMARKSLAKQLLARFVLPEDQDLYYRHRKRLLETGKPRAFDLRMVKKDGTVFWAHLAAAIAQGADGKPVCRLVVSDITERMQMEHERGVLLEAERVARMEAEKAVRLKDEFLATVSHELRNPLNAIMGWNHLLAKGSVAVPKAVEIIGRSASNLTQIVADLLDMSRIISGKTQLSPERVDLMGLVGSVLDGIRPAAEARRIRIEIAFDSKLEPITCDPNRIQQVVLNLLSNAVKFTPEGGAIVVFTARAGEGVSIVVRDNGQGISPDFLPHVFDQFRQGDGSISRRHGGLGLGLAIVKYMVELHGGSVRAESEGLGRGATFTVWLPCCLAHDDRAVAVPRRLEGGEMPENDLSLVKARRVLVVDDDASNCELVARVVEESGATVCSATSGEEGLRLLTEFQPDLVISDISMPEMNGYEFIRRIRAMGGAWASLPCLALTAFARAEDREEALRAGFDEHLPKPFSSGQLGQTLVMLRHKLISTR